MFSDPTQRIALAMNLNDNCNVATYFIGGTRDMQAPAASIGSYIDMVSNRTMPTWMSRDGLDSKTDHLLTPPAW